MYDIVREEIESVNGLAALNLDTITAITNLANQTANSVATVTNSMANLKAAKNANQVVYTGTTTTPSWVQKTREMAEKQLNAGGGGNTVVGENGANPYAPGGSLYNYNSGSNNNNNNQKKETDWTPFFIGGAIGLGLLLVFMMNNKKK